MGTLGDFFLHFSGKRVVSEKRLREILALTGDVIRLVATCYLCSANVLSIF